EPTVASAAAVGATRILSRQDWAADENLMKWVPRTYPVRKAVVHHTVTDDGGSNVAATIRSIYYFHAVTRGWGDIGYSYLVDKFGNVWAGREGGDGTEGGHAYGWNKGSIGLAALGTYSTTAPSPAMVGAIANVIATKFTRFGVQPFGDSHVTSQGTSAGIGVDIGPGGVGVVTVPLQTPAIGNYIVRWDLQTGGTWWNSLYGTPVRDQYFRGADWSADWVSDNVPISWAAGEVKLIQVPIANDGGRVWNRSGAGPVKLGYKWVSNATGNTF